MYGFCRLKVLSVVALGSKYYIAMCIFARAIYNHIAQPWRLIIVCKFALAVLTVLYSLGGFSNCNAVFTGFEAASLRARLTIGLLSPEISSRRMSEHFLRVLIGYTFVCTVPLLVRTCHIGPDSISNALF